MPEYTNAAVQTVASNQNVLFASTPVGCNTGNVIHREGSGIATLRGVTNQCRARYSGCDLGFSCYQWRTASGKHSYCNPRCG